MKPRNSRSAQSNSRRSVGGFRQSTRRTHGSGAWPKAQLPLSASRMRADMSDLDLDDLRAELDDFAQPEKKGGRSAREERIIAGFEEIQRFVEKHGRAPQHGEDRDIFERLYAVRLDRLRALGDCRSLLEPLDRQGLLTRAGPAPDELDDDELLAQLGVDATAAFDLRSFVTSGRLRKSARPRRSPIAKNARTSTISSRCSSRCRTNSARVCVR